MKKPRLAKLKTSQIQAGECFVKAGDPNKLVWKVIALRTATDGIEHARLESRERSITIGSGVLCDHRFWQRMQAA